MSNISISLGVRRKSDAEGAVFKNRSKLKKQIEKTLWRDDYACRCCGFRAERYQRVIPDDRPNGDQFITVCLFCEACFALERTGLSASGVLIWLPELSQVELNHLMRAIYVVRDTDHPLAQVASRTYDALLSRRTEAKKRLGSDDPLLLATVLYESLTDNEYAARGKKLEGIRVLCFDRVIVKGSNGDSNQFPQILNYWKSSEGPYGKLLPDSWADMFASVQSKVNGK